MHRTIRKKEDGRSRRAEASQPFIILIGLVVTAMILIIGYMAVGTTFSTMKRSESIILSQDIERNLERIAASKTSQIVEFKVSPDTAEMVFIDYNYRIVLKDNDYIKKHPTILDMITSGDGRNVLLLDKSGVIQHTFNVGGIEIGALPGYECEGFGVINATHNKVQFRATNKAGILIIGEECTKLNQVIFQEPFDPSLTADNIFIESDQYKTSLRIREDFIASSPTIRKYYPNGTFETPLLFGPSNVNIASTKRLDREYYQAILPEGTKIILKIGFVQSDGSIIWRGKTLAAGDDDTQEGSFYDSSGQFVVQPTDFTNIKVRVYFKSNTDHTQTPALRNLRITYRDSSAP